MNPHNERTATATPPSPVDLNEGALELGMLGQECNNRSQAGVTDLTQDIVSDHAAAKARQSTFGVVPTHSPTATALRAEFHAEANLCQRLKPSRWRDRSVQICAANVRAK